MNAPIREIDPPRHIPYGLAILAQLIDRAGHKVAIIDMNAYRPDRDIFLEELKGIEKEGHIDVFGISGLVTTYGAQKDLLPHIRRLLPNSLIVAGGGCATSIPKEMLEWNPEIDVVCVGEGERTFMELLNLIVMEGSSWYNPHSLRLLKGIMYREGKNIVETEPRPLLTEDELNELPYPAWSMLPMEEIYFKNSPLALSLESLTCKRRIDLITERGCPMSCTYCFHGGMGGDMNDDGTRVKPFVRWQSAEYVVDMIKYARIKLGIDFVSFLDENFLANKKRALEICDRLEDEELVGVVKWGCLGHVNTADSELFTRLRECDCTYISYGPESDDQRMLDYICKSQTVEQSAKALKLTLEANINPIMTYMIGYPIEDMQSIYNTANFWVRNGIICNPFFITAYPHTKLFKDFKEEILKEFDGSMEKYVLELGDATRLVHNFTKFSDPELLGVRQLMNMHDLKRIKKFAEFMRLKSSLWGERELPEFWKITEAGEVPPLNEVTRLVSKVNRQLRAASENSEGPMGEPHA